MAEHSNLTPIRAPQSVWDKRGWRGSTIEERLAPWLVSLGGAGLFAFGASRRSWRGVPFMAAGGSLVVWATADVCNLRGAGVRWQQALRRRAEPDQVTTESMDSFPASDAPSTNATSITGGSPGRDIPLQS
jgi:hypothetical protein